MRSLASLLFGLLHSLVGHAQGVNSTWLLGYQTPAHKISFTDTSAIISTGVRRIPFSTTQANISDRNGVILISSNGQFIANSTGDTMLNGADLNPNSFTINSYKGLPLPNGNVILPYPDDSIRYILIHQTGNYDADLMSTELYFSEIDITGDNGLGEVTLKNQVFIQDTLGWGLGACKHANGRDWWIFALDDSVKYVHKFLLTPSGLNYHSRQDFSGMQPYSQFASQTVFSPDGTKFAFNTALPIQGGYYVDTRLFDFDRCTGVFSNPTIIPIYADSLFGFGVAFSPNSKYLYVSTFEKAFQLNTDTSDVASSLQLVAINDVFASPIPPVFTDFWMMYLAANGKIYITSGSSVVDLHTIHYPDSGGASCNFQLHDFHIPYFNFRSYPFHPNYYLGAENGTVCDSLTIGIEEFEHNFNFSVFPNPNSGQFKILYLLPQNSSGLLEVHDVRGRLIYKQVLPQWSTAQEINIDGISPGVYHCAISSSGHRVNRKVLVFNE